MAAPSQSLSSAHTGSIIRSARGDDASFQSPRTGSMTKQPEFDLKSPDSWSTLIQGSSATDSPVSPHAVDFNGKSKVHRIDTSLSDIEARPNDRPVQRRDWRPWKGHNRRIVLVCCLIFLPMTAFTITILSLIFANRINELACPIPELCPGPGVFNVTNTATHYIVDFPAAQLVFIASWSSTLSFSLISTIMTIYAYTTARQLLALSDSSKEAGSAFLTPYQLGILIRVLNAELMVLWSMMCHLLKDIFWRRSRSEARVRRKAPIVQTGIIVFLVALLGSMLIQAADTYLHLTTDAVESTQLQPRLADNLYYSKGLAPSCLDRPTFGSPSNPNYWSCGFDIVGDRLGAKNFEDAITLNMGLSKENEFLNYIDKDGSHIAILGPKGVDANVDWQASSFGVSTQCHAFRNSSCDLGEPEPVDIYSPKTPFNCSKDRGAMDISGDLFAVFHMIQYRDGWHRFLQEPAPFEGTATKQILEDYMTAAAANLTDDEAGSVFANPWKWISVVTMYDGIGQQANDSSSVTFYTDDYGYMQMLNCNSTVYDVNYTVVNHEVTSVERRLSNSSTTGIANMVLAEMWHNNAVLFDSMSQEVNFLATSPIDFVDVYSQAISRRFLTPFAGQISPRPALLVQVHNSKVVTKVQKAAVWTLVAANMLFAFFGLALTLWAVGIGGQKYKARDVYQVYTRLGVMGLSAQLFEKDHSARQVEDEQELFETRYEEKGRSVKRVGIERTATGGSIFTVSEKGEK